MPAEDPPDDKRSADRAALEHVLGRPLGSPPWPADGYPPGTPVLVGADSTGHHAWATPFTGVIDDLDVPTTIANPRALPDEREYWVQFDGPQFDADGSGPYRKALIWERYIHPIADE
jgi:hypothetical protein